MAWVVPAIAAVGAIAGAIGNSSKQKSTGKSSATTLPTFAPEFGGLRDRLIQDAMARFGSGGAASAARSVTNTNLQGVNSAFGNASTGLSARLASMGIRGPAAGSAMGSLEANRFGQQVGVLNQEPLLERQFHQEDFGNALGVLGLGRGTSMTGDNIANMSGVAGGGLGGASEGIASMLGFLASQGYLNPKPKPGSIPAGGGNYS